MVSNCELCGDWFSSDKRVGEPKIIKNKDNQDIKLCSNCYYALKRLGLI